MDRRAMAAEVQLRNWHGLHLHPAQNGAVGLVLVYGLAYLMMLVWPLHLQCLHCSYPAPGPA